MARGEDEEDTTDFGNVIATIDHSEIGELISSTTDSLLCLIVMAVIIFSLMLVVSGQNNNANPCEEFMSFNGCRFKTSSFSR